MISLMHLSGAHYITEIGIYEIVETLMLWMNEGLKDSIIDAKSDVIS